MEAANFFSTDQDAPALNQHQLVEDMVFQEATAVPLRLNGAAAEVEALAVVAETVLLILADTEEQDVDHGLPEKQDGMPVAVVVAIAQIPMVHFYTVVAASAAAEMAAILIQVQEDLVVLVMQEQQIPVVVVVVPPTMQLAVPAAPE